jgi:hypothetical protein
MNATIKPATKYRVAIRDIAVSQGWTFEQRSVQTDRFTKGATTIDVHHGPSNLIRSAEILVPGKPIKRIEGGGKMFEVQAVLTGQPDPTHKRFIRLNNEQIARYESGQGIAKITAHVSAVIEQADAKAAVKPAPKPAAPAKKVTPAKPAAKRSNPMARKGAPARKAPARKAAAK